MKKKKIVGQTERNIKKKKRAKNFNRRGEEKKRREKGMGSSNSSVVLLLLSFPLLLPFLTSASASSIDLQRSEKVGQRVLMSLTETPKGSNRTFDCSLSGPCVPCLYSEKSDEKYRCSETGYRIPIKCVETDDGLKTENKQKSEKNRSNLEISVSNEISRKRRSLRDDSSTSEGGVRAYITYRSCIQIVNEEKLSVLGFEGIIFGLLLVSGSVVFLRRKRTITMPGVAAGRIQPNSRF
ncbi:uncharacterized protein LOC111317820 isoform X1 [Durio zibethinus]|uniref:Uncharacterized protein LOC111317820 isoform X1 n=1 Tax=Durio zibethinus TaxID=66656 RepID=A0A6P6BFV9_DURZI|nr:uncharacterized protein LOC111317820 isoform X1 [Durio zibethinus]